MKINTELTICFVKPRRYIFQIADTEIFVPTFEKTIFGIVDYISGVGGKISDVFPRPIRLD